MDEQRLPCRLGDFTVAVRYATRLLFYFTFLPTGPSSIVHRPLSILRCLSLVRF